MLLKSSTPAQRPAPPESTVEPPPVLELLLALIDARVSHVEIMDTAGAAEVERYYRARRAARRAARDRQATAPQPSKPVSSRP